jgi:hypothetical protein
LGGPRCKWEENIKMDFSEIWFENVDWNQFLEDMDQWWNAVNTVMNLHIP